MSHKSHSQRFSQNYSFVWLDENFNVNEENYWNSLTKLRQVVDAVDTFINIDECIDFITDRPDEAVFMIISKTYAQRILPIVEDIPQLKSIYIYCDKTISKTLWIDKCSKINDDFTDIVSICDALKQVLKDDDLNEISISFDKLSNGTSNVKKDTLDCSFMYTQILKEILLTINFNNEHFKDFLTFCRAELTGNIKELRNIDKIQNEYRNRTPIWWYTCESFLYSMINKALRLMDIDIIVKMGFFASDLHNHITLLHSQQFNGHTSSDRFIVYRGQGLSQADFDQFKDNRGGLLAFNNFLSTSKKRDVSLRFIHRIATKTDLVPVLFVMHIDPSIKRTPFANIASVSAMKQEEEILFSMHSVFRIGQMKKFDSDNRSWEVELMFTSENDPELHVLTEKVKEETQGPTGWYRLGILMIQLAKFEQAQQLYELLLRQVEEQNVKARIFDQLGQIYNYQGNYKEALKSFEKSLEFYKKSFPADYPLLATIYNNIGVVYNKMDDYCHALEYYQKSLEIKKKSLPVDHFSLATPYNNIGIVYDTMGEYSQALEYYQKSLEILKKSLPADHPDLATTYNNIGKLYNSMSDYSKAFEYFQKSLHIWNKSLPANHPHLAISYNNLGMVYDSMSEYSKALEYYHKSLNIWKESLPADHLYLVTSYNNLGLVFSCMGEYSKALEHFQRALNIRQCSLPSNHPKIRTIIESIEIVKKKL